jgi:sRNA-binding protein
VTDFDHNERNQMKKTEYTAAEAGEILGFSNSGITKLVNSGKLKAHWVYLSGIKRTGRKTVMIISDAEIKKYMEHRELERKKESEKKAAVAAERLEIANAKRERKEKKREREEKKRQQREFERIYKQLFLEKLSELKSEMMKECEKKADEYARSEIDRIKKEKGIK